MTTDPTRPDERVPLIDQVFIEDVMAENVELRARAERAEAATAVFRRELQRRQDSSFDPITQDILDSDTSAIGQPWLDAIHVERARAERWKEAAECAQQFIIASARAPGNYIEGEAHMWLQKFNAALTTADEPGRADDERTG